MNTPKFNDLENFAKKLKCLNFVQKVLHSGVFGLEFLKTIVIFEISILKICQFRKFCEKIKMSKFGTKSALFDCFWAKISKNHSHI